MAYGKALLSHSNLKGLSVHCFVFLSTKLYILEYIIPYQAPLRIKSSIVATDSL